jgi:hypothetical protein
MKDKYLKLQINLALAIHDKDILQMENQCLKKD